MKIDVASPLLGGLTPEQFMRRYWQKRPMLIRQAIPHVQPPLDRAAMFALVGSEDVESRLVVRKGARWTLKHGPFTRRALPPLKQAGWTLLLQGLDLHLQAAHALLDRFRFVPDARLDDLMLSYASDRGGVGPHFDSYDVFLLQVQGQRRWRIGRQTDLSMRKDAPLKILSRFKPTHDWLLQAGDMLYLPPHWAHEGVAVGADCMTCSIGMRAPGGNEVVASVLERMLDAQDASNFDRMYRDPQQAASCEPAFIPHALRTFAADALLRFVNNSEDLSCALGEVLSEPKPRVRFRPNTALKLSRGVVLDRRSRMLYDERHVYLNGEGYVARGRDSQAMRFLANERRIDARKVATLSAEARQVLRQWLQAGWAHEETAIP